MYLIALALAAATPVCEAVWRDPARARDIPVLIRLPAGTARVPVVIFSHGLGGDTRAGTLWGKAWAARGLGVVHVQHLGSDSAVYRDAVSPEDRRARVRAAATGVQLQARVADVGFVLDEIDTRKAAGSGRLRSEGESTETACDLSRLDTARAGIAGHSMGAWTAQAVAGQNYGGAPRLANRRFRAAIALSPSAPDFGSAAEAFGTITIPFLSITGSRDGAPLSPDPALRAAAEAQRTAPYSAMPPGDKYLIVFNDGDHMVFSGNSRRAPTPTDLHIQAAAQTATTAFWGATLLGSTSDAAYLAAPTGLKAALAPGDRLEAK